MMRVAILASGNGSNFQSIIDAASRDELPNCNIILLIANKEEAYAIERAKKHKINYKIIESYNKKREEFDQEVLDVLRENNIEIIVLAGFMRILSKAFIEEYKNKIINIHPSLLPSFPGAHAHRDAIRAGAKESGCTVHIVDEGVDTGPIIMQQSVTVDANDDEDTLASKILPLEHYIFPKALHLLTSGKLEINKGKVIIKSD
ncbi:MAG: phosphoribosylglycinamide formyltransferase [Marine Group III euryarchaeote CG-Epi4]|uniref:phosphoribosylglycinamide formyltransferase 1 n=1 Tax=Marine Group III euryarchaeote CG-Epi4 TaxID=1888998 RepID=A0A1J5TKP5_9ARCH|nr:MAG: phosphoribosylglycinamide formyltransferase [Marine Group III euryarchaeote CG-Epi4]